MFISPSGLCHTYAYLSVICDKYCSKDELQIFNLSCTGVIDNSGIEFFYTSTRRQHDAGIFSVGHSVNRLMVIPPNTQSYSILGECSDDCTNAVHSTVVLNCNM